MDRSITRRRSKRTKTVNNPQTRNNFVELPHELEIEILRRLPAKSVARFLTVSKLWEKTIRSPEFIRSYPYGSSSQPRTLMAIDLNSYGFASEANLHFFKPSSSSTSFMSRLTHPFSYQRHIMEYYYHHVNGLISVGHGQEQIVINPATGKFRTLPRVRTRRKIVNSFFGYDSVSDQYKVLCMTERVHGHLQEASSQHQVLTLGAKKESWKMINCSIPHRPCSNGVCINGVVYYVANTGAELSHLSLMRFALRSDDNLDIFASLPEEIKTTSRYNCILINYEGKVAITNEPTPYTVDVWVMNQEGGKHGWLKKTSFNIVELWKSSCHIIRLRGITHTGEFIYAPVRYADEFYVYYYNPDKNSFRKIKIQVSAVFHRKIAIIFPDYIESIRLL